MFYLINSVLRSICIIHEVQSQKTAILQIHGYYSYTLHTIFNHKTCRVSIILAIQLSNRMLPVLVVPLGGVFICCDDDSRVILLCKPPTEPPVDTKNIINRFT